ncbi:MAG: glutamate-1-semialdehyde 2,1-aminomutase [Desulfobacteraceae bacterium]|nr:glutamate-1-semialdehyde 2,1-aminomutase [Desulfobacteraceae bacterium]MBC2750456.1 glutamate-1-semialdehyde 2,1-aminomutase [Desulfobacteraceae bacterium]
MKTDRSTVLFQNSQKVIPGGVNSPVRACKAVGTLPRFIHRAEGCRLFDADDNAYIDYVGSWGPMILGHRHPAVIQAITEALARGTSFGAPTDLEMELACRVIEAVPSVEMLRMVNSGTEATMSAVRLARGATGRDIIIKFDGCYHGHADTLLVDAGSGVATLNIPGSPGIPASVVQHTLSLPYNDAEAVRSVMAEKGKDVAAIIVEPVAGNMGMVPPAPGFLETLRAVTQENGSLLIFDEVMCGFRVAYGGAQSLYDIRPDLTCFGKIIGGGLPVGAYGGRKDIMSQIAPEGPVYQAGTLSGNPVAMAAGLATLEQLRQPGVYDTLEKRSGRLAEGLAAAARRNGVPASFNRVGSMLGMFFTDRTVENFETAKTSDLPRFGQYYREMLDAGIYLAPSQFEACFVSLAHDDAAIEQTIQAADVSLAALSNG